MENFFVDEKFYPSVEDYVQDTFDDTEDGEESEIKSLPDSWQLRVETTNLEPIFNITQNSIFDMLFDCNEDRIGESYDEKTEAKIKMAISESIDFDKLKLLLPKFYYPTGKFETLAKSDLIEAI